VELGRCLRSEDKKNGGWLLVFSCWLLAIGHWPLAKWLVQVFKLVSRVHAGLQTSKIPQDQVTSDKGGMQFANGY
jgi:hypothetical protein